MKEIKVASGQLVLIDDEDFERVSKYKWSLGGAGYPGRGWRDKKNYKVQKRELMHRFILGAKSGEEVDHIDRNKLNNQKSNLRLCSHRQNQMNIVAHKDNKSGYKGVSHVPNICESRPWRARIFFCGKEYFIGLFSSKEEAALKYNDYAKDLFGKFAYLNKK